MTAVGIGLACTLAFLALYLVCRWSDPRMLRNGVFLTAAILFAGATAVIALPESVVSSYILTLGAALLALIGGIALGVALIVNGLQMLHREGRSLGNLLSLIAGVVVLALPALIVVLFSWAEGFHRGDPLDPAVMALLALLILVASYFGLSFVAFALYAVVYSRMRHRLAPQAIVVLGCGLIGGQVSPLLRSRLDRALALYEAERAAGRRPLLVPSGGKGDDETRAEGAAMAEYLLSQGADPADVAAETASRTTEENLRFSRVVHEEAGRDGQMIVVTSNYHVLRAAVIARRLGLPAQVIGARTANYYVPSAFLREYVAIVVEHRWLNLLVCTPFVAFCAFVAITRSQP
ncbi:Uncharacterized SAM-binding protein YcdF, DUF218 family [Agreia bicolorata]|uniref:Uncharacterized SAM-binding protein YcdF, DUF218 family n=1 Tax=Agreia bicolorata TaxID=110935 RepID=A0A1T4WS32_9MICO|nr:YdcF family protein [Agreia bicolorata]SKA79655.1 Uncharacterized SAM-binding protein YcdF, DUF218 family [Agreia bicolorata]